MEELLHAAVAAFGTEGVADALVLQGVMRLRQIAIEADRELEKIERFLVATAVAPPTGLPSTDV